MLMGIASISFSSVAVQVVLAAGKAPTPVEARIFIEPKWRVFHTYRINAQPVTFYADNLLLEA